MNGPAIRIDLERSLRFPWSGGLHPRLDAVLETDTQIVGIESKRFEPFRSAKAGTFSEAYDRDVWGQQMEPFLRLKKAIQTGERRFELLDAVQLIKHAFGLRTEAQRCKKRPILAYVYADPNRFPSGPDIGTDKIEQHRHELGIFSKDVSGAEVMFASLSHAALCDELIRSADPSLSAHGKVVKARFLSDSTS